MSTTTTSAAEESRVRRAGYREGLRLRRVRQPKDADGPVTYRVIDAAREVVYGDEHGATLAEVAAFLQGRASVSGAVTIAVEPDEGSLPPLTVRGYSEHGLVAVAADWTAHRRYLDDHTRDVLRARLAEWSVWTGAELDRKTDGILAAERTARGEV